MTLNVQGSAASIGLAPGGQQGSSVLRPLVAQPALSGQGAAAGQATGGGLEAPGAPGTVATAAPATAPGAVAAPAGVTAGADPTRLLSQGRWLGPLVTLGGGAMAIRGFSASAAATAAAAAGSTTAVATKAPGLLKWGGVAAAVGGLALTGMGFKAKGIEVGTRAGEATGAQAMAVLTAQAEQVLGELSARNAALEAQLATAQQQAAGAGEGAATSPGTGAGQGGSAIGGATPGAATTPPTTPGRGGVVLGEDGKPAESAPIVDGATPGVGVGLNTTVVPTTGTAPASGSPVQAMVGSTVNLAAGQASGTVIADAGTYRIEQVAGDAAGYATLDEANAAARSTMSTELMGSKFLRWMVVEQGGRYYGVVAKQIGAQEQAKPLPSTAGAVVAWSAMNHVAINGTNGWRAYSWTATGGEQVTDVPYGTSAVFGAGPAGTGAIGGGPVVAAPAATRAAAFDPATVVGRTFSVNASTTAEGDVIRGGPLQLQRFVDGSAGGFGTPEEAATVARQARASGGAGDQWSRTVTLQGSDGRYYVYQGSIVKRETDALQGAAPMHVFGAGFASYFDAQSSSWRALRDAA